MLLPVLHVAIHSLKRLVEKELDAEVSENARKKLASLCAFITESILHTENVTDISQLCIKYVKFLNDEGVEKVRLEKGLMAILISCLVDVLRPLSQRIFFMRFFTDLEKKEYMKMIGVRPINLVQLSFHDTRPGTHIRINVHTSTAGDSQHCCLLIFLSFFVCAFVCLSDNYILRRSI